MCDTIVATPTSVAAGVTLFGKNSDRQRNEAQVVECFPAADYDAGTLLKCTYITIPQVRHTYAVLLCRPFWMWGAEMGANERGVAIGNEALYARSPAPQADALTGMDLVRLALERAGTAAEAVAAITSLLQLHGQGGNCGHLSALYYNNGFLIADGQEAYVLETVGKEWMLERLDGVRAMSNRYSIDRAVSNASDGLLALIRAWSTVTEPSYADVLADPSREHIGNAGARRACATSLLRSRDGVLTTADMMTTLRSHGDSASWTTACSVQRTVCMHAGGAEQYGQTVGSMVSELHHERAVHWVTATAAPCISIYKPVLMNVQMPHHGPRPSDRFDPSTLWWRHEDLHRAALAKDFGSFLEQISAERDALEAHFRERVNSALRGGDSAQCSDVIAQCWQAAHATELRWRRMIDRTSSADAKLPQAWQEMNALAGLTV